MTFHVHQCVWYQMQVMFQICQIKSISSPGKTKTIKISTWHTFIGTIFLYMLLYTYPYVHSQFDKIRPETRRSIHTIIVHTHIHSLKHTEKLISNSTISVNMNQLPVHMRHHTTFISFNIIGYIFSRQSNLFFLLIN